MHPGVGLIKEPGRFTVGLPYSLGLMLILGAQELGHYFAAKRHGIRVSPPYFIPVPFALRTFGAFIKLKSLAPESDSSTAGIWHTRFSVQGVDTLISVGALITLFALALFVWPGLMMWAVIVWFIAGTRDAPALNDLTALNPGRRALGWFAFLLLAAIMIPVPHALYPWFGIHCPYL